MLTRLLDDCRMDKWSGSRFIKSTGYVGGGTGDDAHYASTTASHPEQPFRGLVYSTRKDGRHKRS